MCEPTKTVENKGRYTIETKTEYVKQWRTTITMPDGSSFVGVDEDTFNSEYLPIIDGMDKDIIPGWTVIFSKFSSSTGCSVSVSRAWISGDCFCTGEEQPNYRRFIASAELISSIDDPRYFIAKNWATVEATIARLMSEYGQRKDHDKA